MYGVDGLQECPSEDLEAFVQLRTVFEKEVTGVRHQNNQQ